MNYSESEQELLRGAAPSSVDFQRRQKEEKRERKGGKKKPEQNFASVLLQLTGMGCSSPKA